MTLNTGWSARHAFLRHPLRALVARENVTPITRRDRFAIYNLLAVWLAGCGCSGASKADPSGAAGSGAAGNGGVAGNAGAAGGDEGGFGECAAELPGEVVGWASVPDLGVTTTVGGAGGPTVSVSTIAELRTHLAGTAPKIIQVKGTFRGNLTIGSNKTIIGCGARLEGHIEMSGSVNVIFRNMTVVGYAVGDCALDPT
jgi:hypothetical protein